MALRLLLSACTVVVAVMVSLTLAIGFDSDRRQGGTISYVLMAAAIALLLWTLWAIWHAKPGWWQWLWMVVMLPLALAILWMLGVLPCSTNLNCCPFR